MVESFLIIGGSSDIAMILAKQLGDSGHKVTLLARDISRTSKLQETGIDVVQGDALESEALQLAIEQAKINGEGKISGPLILLVQYCSNLHML